MIQEMTKPPLDRRGTFHTNQAILRMCLWIFMHFMYRASYRAVAEEQSTMIMHRRWPDIV